MKRCSLVALVALVVTACDDTTQPEPTALIQPPQFGAVLGTLTQITTDPGDQVLPDISGDRIVWSDGRAGGRNIFMFDLRTNTESAITTDPAAQFVQPRISGERIVWANQTSPSGIQMFDLATVRRTQITSDFAEQPGISGDLVVWGALGPGPVFDIRMFDLATGLQTTVATGPSTQRDPAISGRRIVWHDFSEVFMFDVDIGTETQITNDPGRPTAPEISGDRIVWNDRRNGNLDVFMFDLRTGTETQITSDPATQVFPVISGDWIVWEDFRRGNRDIFMFDLVTRTEAQITRDKEDQLRPRISGDRVVWYDLRTGNPDIFMFEISAVVPGVVPGLDGFGCPQGFDASEVEAGTGADKNGDGIVCRKAGATTVIDNVIT